MTSLASTRSLRINRHSLRRNTSISLDISNSSHLIIPSMLQLKARNGESLLLDGAWLEKRRGPESVSRVPVKDYQSYRLDKVSSRAWICCGDREEVLVLTVQAGVFLGLQIPAQQKNEVEGFMEAEQRASMGGIE